MPFPCAAVAVPSAKFHSELAGSQALRFFRKKKRTTPNTQPEPAIAACFVGFESEL